MIRYDTVLIRRDTTLDIKVQTKETFFTDKGDRPAMTMDDRRTHSALHSFIDLFTLTPWGYTNTLFSSEMLFRYTEHTGIRPLRS